MKQKISLHFSCIDNRILDASVKKIQSVLKNEGWHCSGIIPIPTRSSLIACRKDPFIYKESQEHYVYEEHKRTLVVWTEEKNKNLIVSLGNIQISAAVEVNLEDALAKKQKLVAKQDTSKS